MKGYVLAGLILVGGYAWLRMKTSTPPVNTQSTVSTGQANVVGVSASGLPAPTAPQLTPTAPTVAIQVDSCPKAKAAGLSQSQIQDLVRSNQLQTVDKDRDGVYCE